MGDVALRGFRDVHGQITHAFEIGVDLDGRDDGAQVDRQGLMEREEPEAAVVDLDVKLIDRLVSTKHLLDERGIP